MIPVSMECVPVADGDIKPETESTLEELVVSARVAEQDDQEKAASFSESKADEQGSCVSLREVTASEIVHSSPVLSGKRSELPVRAVVIQKAPSVPASPQSRTQPFVESVSASTAVTMPNVSTENKKSEELPSIPDVTAVGSSPTASPAAKRVLDGPVNAGVQVQATVLGSKDNTESGAQASLGAGVVAAVSASVEKLSLDAAAAVSGATAAWTQLEQFDAITKSYEAAEALGGRGIGTRKAIAASAALSLQRVDESMKTGYEALLRVQVILVIVAG